MKRSAGEATEQVGISGGGGTLRYYRANSVCLFCPRLFPIGVIEGWGDWDQDSGMRVNLSTRPSRSSPSAAGALPLLLTIRPSCGIPGD